MLVPTETLVNSSFLTPNSSLLTKKGTAVLISAVSSYTVYLTTLYDTLTIY